MIVHRMIDILKSRSNEIARILADSLKASPNLRRCKELTAEQLILTNMDLFPLLARWYEGGADRNEVGGFFVRMGKERLKQGFSISEAIYVLHLSQKTVIEYLVDQNILENSVDLYNTLELTTRVSEFYMLATYYTTKGYLEDAYLGLAKTGKAGKVSEEQLRRFLSDDFFFKGVER
jgi:hypothetical protein